MRGCVYHPFAALTRGHRGHRGHREKKRTYLALFSFPLFRGEAASVLSVPSSERSEWVVKLIMDQSKGIWGF